MAILEGRGPAGIRAVILDYGEVISHRQSEGEFERWQKHSERMRIRFRRFGTRIGERLTAGI